MDYQFPSQLFPGFYNRGPPDSVSQHRAGSWGGYDRVTPVGGAGDLSSWTFTARHQVKGEVWSPTEPAPVPLLSPKHSVLWPSTPPDPMDFVDHMQNFYSDHYQDAFGCMSEILGHDFNFESKKCKLYSANMQKMKRFVDMMKFKKCELAYSSKVMDSYATMLTDVMHTIPPQLLGSLLHEELTGQRDRMLVSEEATGGALAFVPFSHSGSGSQHGCLIYPRRGLHLLNFHTVALQHQREGPSCVDAKSHPPFSFQLRGPVRQISTASLFNHCCVAVRSDHLCGVWRFAETVKPRLLQAINTTEVATCISVSPHILGEVLVASERGAAVLWTVGRGIQKIREDEDNLYFNAKSSWRWCEFSAHPRVILYADRTGVELTDIREKSATTHTLFHISNTSECRSGERLFLSRYLGEVHPFHHLITTQYSAYVVDERFAAMPMIKLDHVMQLPPIFCEIVPGCDASISSGGESRTTKILLGSHRSQEITMLQYSGGRAEASLSQGPPRSLHRPQDSLKHLPVQIPHRLVTAKSRLSSPALGLTCMHKTGRAEECICVLQLTEAGDIFYQILQPEASVGEELLPQTCESHPPPAELLVHGPPQMQQGASNMDSHYSSELEMKSKALKQRMSGPPLVQNDEADAVCDADDGNVRTVLTATTETPQSVKGNIGDKSVAKLSSGSLFAWKRWLQKLMRRSHRTKFGPHTLQHVLVSTKGLLHHSAEDPSEEQCVERLWQDLTKCMSERSLLVGSTVSASLSPPEVVPLPNAVETDTWTDDLSNRLTVSWQGEDAWHSWWKEKLGLDREQKVEALKRKRRREKEARRASGHHPKLSDSFSSSASCLSEWDNFSDSTSWFSTASQATWSDSDTGSTQRSQDLPRAATQSTAPTGSPVPTLTATSHVKNKQSTLKSPSSSCPLLGSQTPTENFTQARQRTRHTLDSYLSSQDDENHFQEVGHIIQSRSNVPSFQFQSSQPFSQSRARVDLSPEQPRLSQSQDRPALSHSQDRPRLSQFQDRPALSQSQDRPRLSQSQDQPALSHSQDRPRLSQFQDQPALSQSQDRPALSHSQDRPRLSQFQDQPALSQSQDRPALSHSQDRPRLSQFQDWPALSQSQDRPRLSQSQDRPALSQFQHWPALSQSQSQDRPRLSQSQDRPRLSQSQDRPALSQSQDRPRLSQSQDRPALSQSQDRPRLSQSQDRPRLSQSLDRPRLSQFQHRPALSQSQDRPALSQSQDRPRLSQSLDRPRLSQSRPALSQFQHRPALSQSQSQSQSRPALSQSQDRPALSQSQSQDRPRLSQSQSSQSCLGISQSSQPKKKSRMGF